MTEFRLIPPSEYRQYYEVLHEGYQSVKQYPISFDAADTDEAEAKEWLSNHPTYGLYEETVLVSAVSLRMPWGNLPGPSGVPHIGRFVTHPNYKGRGYAKELFHQLEQEVLIQQLRTPKVTLGTASTHPWLKKMYEQLGFEAFDQVQLLNKQHVTIYFEKNYKGE